LIAVRVSAVASTTSLGGEHITNVFASPLMKYQRLS
jgi:hypothetical protein